MKPAQAKSKVKILTPNTPIQTNETSIKNYKRMKRALRNLKITSQKGMFKFLNVRTEDNGVVVPTVRDSQFYNYIKIN